MLGRITALVPGAFVHVSRIAFHIGKVRNLIAVSLLGA